MKIHNLKHYTITSVSTLRNKQAQNNGENTAFFIPDFNPLRWSNCNPLLFSMSYNELQFHYGALRELSRQNPLLQNFSFFFPRFQDSEN